MKKIKKCICFFVLIQLIFVFSACGSVKQNNKPQDVVDPEIEQPQEPEQPKVEPEEEPEIISLTSSDILLSGYKVASDFLNDYQFDLLNGFDSLIYNNKTRLSNTFLMLKKFAEFENLPYDKCVKGQELSLENYSGVPSKINKFLISFKPVNQNGDASIEVKMIIGFHELDDNYTYDFYYFNIAVNVIEKVFSFESSIEKAYASGVSNSSANYTVFNLNGTWSEDTLTVGDFAFYNFDRTAKIKQVPTAVNNNYIKNFGMSKSVSGETQFFDKTISDSYFRDPNSEPVEIVSTIIGRLNQKLNVVALSGTLKTVANLTENIVICDNDSQNIA